MCEKQKREHYPRKLPEALAVGSFFMIALMSFSASIEAPLWRLLSSIIPLEGQFYFFPIPLIRELPMYVTTLASFIPLICLLIGV